MKNVDPEKKYSISSFSKTKINDKNEWDNIKKNIKENIINNENTHQQLKNGFFSIFSQMEHESKLLDDTFHQIEKLKNKTENDTFNFEMHYLYDLYMEKTLPKIDVYGLGVSILMCWKLSLLKNKKKFLDDNSKLHMDVLQLVSKMCHPDVDKRLSPKEAILEYKNIKSKIEL